MSQGQGFPQTWLHLDPVPPWNLWGIEAYPAVEAGSLQHGFIWVQQKLAGSPGETKTPVVIMTGPGAQGELAMGSRTCLWPQHPSPFYQQAQPDKLAIPQHFICYFCLIHHKYTGTHGRGIL